MNMVKQGKAVPSTVPQKILPTASGESTSTAYKKQSTGLQRSSDPLLQKHLMSTRTRPKVFNKLYNKHTMSMDFFTPDSNLQSSRS